MSTNQEVDLNASLSSLAMLSLQMREGRDYLDYLRGFVVESIKLLRGEPFDAVKLHETVQIEFGLKIPVATFAIYLKRLVKERTIIPLASGIQFQASKLPETTVTADRHVAKIQIAEVTDELAGFAHQRFSLKWDDRLSTVAIADFLRRYSIDFLRFVESKSPLPEYTSEKESTAYVVAAFVTNAAKEKPSLFQSIRILVQSHILANALMCPDLVKEVRGFRGVHFFLDTRFMLKVLDLESRYDTENTRTLLVAIRKLKGVLCMFPETKDELRTVLRAIARGMQQGAGRGPVYRELLKRQRGVADVILAERNLDTTLADLSITMYPQPNYSEDSYQFQIDEANLRDEIEGQIDYISEQAAIHDIRVVRHIFALRKGRRIASIEEAGHVFLTTNSALSRAAFNYERRNSRGWIFSSVVTDYHLSHLAWLKSPMEVSDLPRTDILANCYATMQPNESIWNHYLEEVTRLKDENKVSEKDHEALRFSLNAPEEVMDVTRGDIEGITEKNIHVILENLEKTYAAEKDQKLAKIRVEHEETKRALVNAELTAQENEKQKLVIIEREKALIDQTMLHEQALDHLKSLQAQHNARDEARAMRIEQIADGTARKAFIIIGVVFAAAVVLALFSNSKIWYGVPATIICFFNLWCGFSGNAVEKAVKDWMVSWFSKFVD